MSMYGRDPWGGPLEIAADSATDDDRSRNLQDYDRAALSRPLDETQQSWLLGPGEQKKKKYVDLGCIIVSRKIFVWTVGTILAAGFLAGFITLIVKTVPRHHHRPSPPDNYTLALNKALMFFNAQRSGRLPKHNNVSWRGNSCVNDGESDSSTLFKDLSGGYYDAGDAIKFNFPQSFAMTMLSWSVIEYSAKYEAAGELNHVKDIIKWGTDYFLKTFNHTADSIDRIVAQVGKGGNKEDTEPNDHYCWMRPEDIDYDRPVTECHSCSDLAAEMAAALASASIVFKDNKAYSQKLVHGAKTLFKFSRDQRGRYSVGSTEAATFYNSTGYYDEFVWGASWLYYATGNTSYLQLATTPGIAKHAGAFWGGPYYGVLSWDNKLAGSQVLLSRLRLFLSPGYPYEEILSTFHNQTKIFMCSYLPYFTSFNRTRGGMIQLNHGSPQPLQYVVNAAFLATVFSDYMKAADTPGWNCGPHFYSTDVLRDFAETQINYILGKNPRKMSYVVGFGNHYPKHVHHRGASIPKNKVKYNCKGGWKWRDSKKPNPNTIVGAMVAGPDRHDGFHDVRTNYNYTEPTLAGNAGLVAALVALSGETSVGVDKNTIFSWEKGYSGDDGKAAAQNFMEVMVSLVQSNPNLQAYFDADTIIKSTCQVLITAASDTSTVILIWVLSLLLNHPHVLKKAQSELDQQVGRERRVEESDISNLPYLQAVVKETLRLYPPAPFAGARMFMEDCTVGGFTVQKGTILLLNLWKLHRDPRVWSDDVLEFKPERFLDRHKNVEIKVQDFEYMPFGGGRRMCPGSNLGIRMVLSVLANLLQAFDLSTVDDLSVDMTESVGLTNMKATPLEILLKPRLSHHLY